jgi:hypothetical protein
MTEAEWRACADPQPMLVSLRGQASERKLRLFACACCRRIGHPLVGKRGRQAVEVAERFADGLAGKDEVSAASAGLAYLAHLDRATGEIARGFFAHTAVSYLFAAAEGGAVGYAAAVSSWACGADRSYAVAHAAQAPLLRDIFGPAPFRPLPLLNPGWLAWEGGTVPKLAASIYAERAFDRLPILADALEEAGCDDAELLAHLRGPGPHARGCWPLDMLLGKQ